MLRSPIFKRLLVATIFVLSTGFYSLIFFPESFRNLLQMAGLGIIFFVLALKMFAREKHENKLHFKNEIFLFLLATFLSMFIAKDYHNQDFTVTLVAQRHMYFFFFYFFLHSIKIEVQDIEKLILPLALIYVLIYISQTIAYPTLIVDSRVGMERGTVRIFIPGGGFAVLAYYLYLQKFLESNKFKYGALSFVFFVVPALLQGTRQSLASITLLTVAFIFFNKRVKSRAFVIFLAGIAAVTITIIFHDIFLELLAVTQKESTAQKENIRLVSIRFFLTEFMPHKLAYIFGNGQDSMNSAFGRQVNFYKTLGLYQSDIGLIGDFSKFGILFVIAQLSIMGRIIFGKLPANLTYFRYFFISRALTMFTGSNIFSGASGVAFVMILLFILDVYKNQESDKLLKPAIPPPKTKV